MRAINSLESGLFRCHKIRPNIASNDKTPSWDGDIEVYKSNTFSKDNLLGTVSVQVKGKWVDELPISTTVKFQVSVADLNNYLKSNGVVFFVIHCNDDGGKVYYKSLMPVDIYMLLKDNPPLISSKSIELQEFPSDDPEVVYGIFNDFIYHSSRQAQLDKEAIDKFTKLGMDSVASKFSFGFGALPTSSEEKRIRYMLDHETYIYAKPNDFDVDVALGKMSVATVGMQRTVPITVNGEVLYKEITKLYSSDGSISVKIGDNITFSEEKKKFSFVYSSKLSERIRDLKFVVGLLEDNKNLDETEIVLHQDNGDGLSYKELKNVLQFYLDLEAALKMMGCDKELQIDGNNIKDLNKMKALVNAFIYDKPVPYSLNGEPGLGTLEFGNIKLLIFCIKDGKDFRFSNPYEMKDLVVKYEFVDEGHTLMASPYFIALTKDRLTDVDNLNCEAVEESIKKFRDGSDTYDQELNRYILEVIGAYDICKKQGLLEMASRLQEILDNTDPENIVYVINRAQIEKRKNSDISKEDKKTLLRIKQTADNNLALLCCCILLESFDEAELYFDALSEEERESFELFPIKNLWRE